MRGQIEPSRVGKEEEEAQGTVEGGLGRLRCGRQTQAMNVARRMGGKGNDEHDSARQLGRGSSKSRGRECGRKGQATARVSSSNRQAGGQAAPERVRGRGAHGRRARKRSRGAGKTDGRPFQTWQAEMKSAPPMAGEPLSQLASATRA